MTHTVRSIYDKLAPYVAVLLILACAGLAGATYVNDRNDGIRDRARVAENTRLLECFDRFASTLAGGLPPVREASAARDAAAERRDEADSHAANGLKGLLIAAVNETATPADVRDVIARYEKLGEAQEALTVAYAELERVRKANPYPEAPSEFCADD